MKQVNEAIEGYFRMWNEPDPHARRSVIDGVWTETARSVDPLAAVEGRDAIDAMVAGVQESYPGHRFARVGEVRAHHDRAQFAWEMRSPEGAVVLSGIDCVRLAEDGRIEDLAGFFDAAAAA